MGAFISNCHIKTTNYREVIKEYKNFQRKNGKREFEEYLIKDYKGDFNSEDCQVSLISPVRNGWVSIYDSEFEDQHMDNIKNIVSYLSKKLRSPSIYFLIHDSNIFIYKLFDNSVLIIDEYNSKPNFFKQVSNSEMLNLKGNPKILKKYCNKKISVEQIKNILEKDALIAEEIMTELATEMDIKNSNTSYNYINEDKDLIDRWNNFIVLTFK